MQYQHRDLFRGLTILGCLVILGCAGGQKTAAPVLATDAATILPADGPTETDYPALHNLLQITDDLYSGGEPHSEEAFASLARLGIKTVVSVDGATPDVALARKHGLRYVHIPIGYDGIGDDAGRAFARLAKEGEGPLYVHCHHGKHRGPAAAAITCVAMGETDSQGALAILKKAGTSENYGGLWRDVKNYQVPASGSELPELVEIATIDSLAAAMAQIDRAWDHLVLCRDAGWKTPPDHPDLVPAQEALLIREGLRESARNLGTDYDAQFLTWLTESETIAEQLEAGIRDDVPQDGLSERFDALKASCTQCHTAYRN